MTVSSSYRVATESTAARFKDRLAAAPIADAEVPALLALIWSTASSPALAQLVRHRRAAFTS